MMAVTVTLITLLVLILATLTVQLLSKMKLVPPSQLGVVHGREEGFSLIRGGRVFVLPLINAFDTMDLKPQTNTIEVESAIARGIVPLTVKATVSFAVARSERGLINAVKRILHLTDDWNELRDIATSIMEGHLRDTIAAMSPEEVMSQKEQLIRNMIQVCRSDLEEIGLEITTMNIADVDDHRLEGVEEPDLYIALLKRVQSADAETQSRMAKAEAQAISKEEQEKRRAEVQVRNIENEYQRIDADTKVRVAEEEQRGAVGAQEATRNAESELAGIHAEINAERERIEMVRQQLKANTIVPAEAQQYKKIEEARAETAEVRGRAQSELNQLRRTIEILDSGNGQGATTYLIEVFNDLVEHFASSMDLFPVDHVTVIAGNNPTTGPISAIHPNALDSELTRRISDILGAGQRRGQAGSSADGETDSRVDDEQHRSSRQDRSA